MTCRLSQIIDLKSIRPDNKGANLTVTRTIIKLTLYLIPPHVHACMYTGMHFYTYKLHMHAQYHTVDLLSLKVLLCMEVKCSIVGEYVISLI